MREDVKRVAGKLTALYTFPHLTHCRVSIRLAACKGAHLDVVNRKLGQVAVGSYEEIVIGKGTVVGRIPQAGFVGKELVGFLVHEHIGKGFLGLDIHRSKAIIAAAGVGFEVDGAVNFARLDTSRRNRFGWTQGE
jgi:hypothetical protein